MDDKPNLIIRSRTPNRDYLMETPGGGVFSKEYRIANCHWWHLQRCLATEAVSIKFVERNKTLTRNLGQSGDVSEGFTLVQLATATPQAILFTAGDDREQDELGNGGVVLTKPVGERLYNTDADSGNPAITPVSGAVFPAGLTMILPGVAGFKIRVFNYNFSLPVANDFQFYEEDGNPAVPVSARGYGVIGGDEVAEPVFECAEGKQLDVWLLNPGILSVQVAYELVPV